LLLVTLPSAYSILSQIVRYGSGPDRELVRTALWFRSDSPDDARFQFRFLDRLSKGIVTAAERVPDDACIGSASPGAVSFYGLRFSRLLPPRSQGQTALETALKLCPYVMMLNVQRYPPADYPPLYPLNELTGPISAVYQERLSPGDESSPLLVLLTRSNANVR
jgi:hypothetical protein